MSVPVTSINGRSFQQIVMSQPVKMGGLGLRKNEETSLPAFIGGLELALPHLVGPSGVCKNLESVLGDGTAPDNTRWQPLIESGARTGAELRKAWQKLSLEDDQSCEFLQQEKKGPLTVEVTAAGNGATDGSTRRKIMQRREELRGAVFNEAIMRNPNQRCRQVLCWRSAFPDLQVLQTPPSQKH